MRESMESMLDADRAARLEHLRARQNRPLVKPITVIVTASGAPGTAALLRGAARERRARGAARRHRHERALGRPAPLRRVPPRARRAPIPRSPTRCSRSPSARASTRSCRSRRSTSKGWPAQSTRFPMPVLVSSPDAIHRSNDKAETYELLHRLGLPRAGVPARERRARGRGRGARARLPGPAGLLQAGLLVRLARLPHPRPDRRPRAPAPATSGPGSVAMRLEEAVELLPDEGGPDLLVMELATGGERTIDGIAQRPRDRARPPEDARGDARRPRDVLRHARRRRADAQLANRSSPSSGSSTSSTSSSSATT